MNINGTFADWERHLSENLREVFGLFIENFCIWEREARGRGGGLAVSFGKLLGSRLEIFFSLSLVYRFFWVSSIILGIFA